MPEVPENLLAIFWVEASEYLEQLNQLLLALEVGGAEANGSATLREVSRIAHSLKGAARAVGEITIESLAHQMEEVFDAALAGQLSLTPEVADALYDGLDVIQGIAAEREIDPEMVIHLVERLIGFAHPRPGPPPGAPPGPANGGPRDDGPTEEVRASGDDEVGDALAPDDEDDLAYPGEAAATLQRVRETLEFESQPLSPADPRRVTRTVLIAPTPLETVEEIPAQTPRGSEDTIRVSVSKLDELMEQTSELLVARMHNDQRRQEIRALLHDYRRWRSAWRQARTAYIRAVRRLRRDGDAEDRDNETLLDFVEQTQQFMGQAGRALAQLNRALSQDSLHLSTLVGQFQDDIASVRMLPFETILGTFQRMVRDLARDTGKEIDFVIEGQHTEVDKHVLESLKDPLMHLLRNAVDHGIEPTGVRLAAGKTARGTVHLRITQRGNDIQVSIGDDGRGISTDRVRDKAVEIGVISHSEAESMTTTELAALIFVPRFSTAGQVTTVSGRGVGLDVVQQRVEALRGRIWLENTPGHGVTFHLVVPVTLARLHCLLARLEEETYAVPLNAVVTILNLDPNQVLLVEGRAMLPVQGRPTPLVHLADVLERPGIRRAPGFGTPVLVLQATERMVAFVVDELLSEQELVLKKLGPELRRVRNVAGAAILGTGEVAVILNTNDLIKSIQRTYRRLPDLRDTQPVPVLDELDRDRPSRILVVDDSITARTLEKNILEAAGFQVRTVTDGDEALQALLEDVYDLVVSDVEMPHMDGFELTRRIKSDARWRHMPVVLVTSLDSQTDRERGLQSGADAYLVKPRFDQDELLQMIQRMVL